MYFFDFTYLVLCKFYSYFNEKAPHSSCAGLIGGLQTFNILTVLLGLSISLNFNVGINKIIGFLLFVVLQVFNYLRYFYNSNFSIEKIEIRWSQKSPMYRKNFKLICLLYVLFSFISLFGFALYFNYKNI
jgi:hypothetical protein